MRIAIYHNLPSGGASRTVYETVRRLAQRHQLDLFCPSTADRAFCDISPYVGETMVLGFNQGRLYQRPLGRFNSLVRLVDLWRLEAIGRRAARVIDERQYDIVLVHPCIVTEAPSILRFLNTPNIYYCQEPLRFIHDSVIPRPYLQESWYRRALDRVDPMRKAYRSILRRIDYQNARSANLVLTSSLFVRERIKQIYQLDAQVNRLGVDSNKFKPLNLPKDYEVISVGVLAPIKGFDFVIRSVATIPLRQRPILTIASYAEVPGERNYLQRLAKQEAVQVEFLAITAEAMSEFYNRAAILTCAPVGEPLGLVALESQACGTPVVGVAEGGVRETIVHKRTGLLTERDTAAFGRAISSLLADQAVREEYGRQGRVQVQENWNWDFSVAELEQMLIKLIEQKCTIVV